MPEMAVPQPKLEELSAEVESHGKGGARMREPDYRVWVKPLNTFLPIASIDFYNKEVWVWGCGNEDCGLCDDGYKFDEVDLVPYTGIDTAEGVKVFKNDIFGYFEANSDKSICYGVVKYRNDYDQYRTHNPCGYVMEWQLNSKVPVPARNLREDLPFWCDSYSNAKKVGNIYENPELLEVKE